MFEDSLCEIRSNTYINKVFIDTPEDVNVEEFHRIKGFFSWDVPLASRRTIHVVQVHLFARVHPCLTIRCAAMNLSDSEWFAVAGQGIAPCLGDYEPPVQLYTTPHVLTS